MNRDQRTHAIIGAAMEVHGILGPGLLEAVYQDALEIELELRSIPFVSKPKVTINTKGRQLHPHYKPDLIVFEGVVVELKAQSSLGKNDDSQLLNALKCSQLKVGLLINFGESSLKWKRFVN
jgi:GxxExxY protein